MKQHLNIQKFWGETENTVSESMFGAFRLSYPSSIIAALDTVGVGHVQDFQFHGVKLVISEILMSISESVIIVID